MDINELIYMREKQMMEYGFSMYTTYLFKKYWNEYTIKKIIRKRL